MRDIKFRIWNKLDNLMKNPYGIIWTPDGNIVGFDGGTEYFGFEDVEIMQYTGLQDSYGKDIYEGDLVRILYTDWRSPEFAIETLKNLPLDEYKRKISSIGVVTFYADKYAEWGLDMKGYSESIYQGTHGEKEVIGNIYENPEIFKSI